MKPNCKSKSVGEVQVSVSQEALMSDLRSLGQSDEGEQMEINVGGRKKARRWFK